LDYPLTLAIDYVPLRHSGAVAGSSSKGKEKKKGEKEGEKEVEAIVEIALTDANALLCR